MMQDLVAGMAFRWQMGPACLYLYGPSDLAPGEKSIMIPKRCDTAMAVQSISACSDLGSSVFVHKTESSVLSPALAEI